MTRKPRVGGSIVYDDLLRNPIPWFVGRLFRFDIKLLGIGGISH
jgi:hypothetical protein